MPTTDKHAVVQVLTLVRVTWSMMRKVATCPDLCKGGQVWTDIGRHAGMERHRHVRADMDTYRASKDRHRSVWGGAWKGTSKCGQVETSAL